MQFATWNVNSLTVRLPQVIDWLAANPVAVLGLQELKLTDDKFPLQAFLDAGYNASFFGQKTYNGVALLTKAQATNVVKNIPNFTDEQARVIAATVPSSWGDIRIVNGYFVNGQAPGTDKFEYKMNWLRGLRDYLRNELEKNPRLVVMGDFNITRDDADSHDPEGLRETIHHTTLEREQLKALLALGLIDAHRLVHPDLAVDKKDKFFSWWDYRDFGFRRNRGLRIDYVLASEALKPHIASCTIDKTPRKNERPSDHTPVVMELRP
ncbi:MAG: exodeoxyribonuclease III [Cytophagales bacterium]|nr:exodeoxyribonuclease III [Cytophagales bacterium]